MDKEQDYASDSDESDEDFRPEITGVSDLSEENESGGSDIENTKEDELEEAKKPKRGKRKNGGLKANKLNKSQQEEIDESTSRRTRQTEDTNGKTKCIEKDELDDDDEDESRKSALWADFLKDVKPVEAISKPPKATESIKTSSSTNGSTDVTLATVKRTNSPKKITVTEVLDFAGEEVRVQKTIDASSIKENQAAATSAPKKQPFGRIMPGAGIKRTSTGASSSGSAGGLGSILNQIGKKQKISVLEKTKMDWNSFKQDEGIDEQLQTFNKGKNGYLERQDFLQRTDLRQFEIEKNLRQSGRRPL